MSSKALEYAENELGVHSVYVEAQTLLKELDSLISELDAEQDKKRSLTSAIEDRGFELLSIERGKHADMSASGLEQHLKVVKHRDSSLREYRIALEKVLSTIQGLEYDVDVCKIKLKLATARLEELGGYLHYLAAVKEAATVTRATKDKL